MAHNISVSVRRYANIGNPFLDKDMWKTRLGVYRMRVVLFAVLVVLCCERGDALYFHIGETESKCFIEEVPGETMIVGG